MLPTVSSLGCGFPGQRWTLTPIVLILSYVHGTIWGKDFFRQHLRQLSALADGAFCQLKAGWCPN